MAARGEKRFDLTTELPETFSLPSGFSKPQWCLPGILCVEGTDAPSSTVVHYWDGIARASGGTFAGNSRWAGLRMVVLVDDSEFTSRTLNNFLWVTFTRSNPANDVDGVGAFTDHKHWGCTGPLVIDARIKPHHAPPLSPAERLITTHLHDTPTRLHLRLAPRTRGMLAPPATAQPTTSRRRACRGTTPLRATERRAARRQAITPRLQSTRRPSDPPNM